MCVSLNDAVSDDLPDWTAVLVSIAFAGRRVTENDYEATPIEFWVT